MGAGPVAADQRLRYNARCLVQDRAGLAAVHVVGAVGVDAQRLREPHHSTRCPGHWVVR